LTGHQRQLTTNAHASVEISLMKQKERKRSLLHLVNLSGHSTNTFFDAIEMKNISIRLQGKYKKAVLLDGGQNISATIDGNATRFTIPVLKEYAAVVLYE